MENSVFTLKSVVEKALGKQDSKRKNKYFPASKKVKLFSFWCNPVELPFATEVYHQAAWTEYLEARGQEEGKAGGTCPDLLL